MGGEASAWIPRIRESVIGDDVVLDGPFGPRRMVYADAAASGRALGLVEDVIRDQVLPMYGNTHTEASATGRCTTGWRERARGTIHDAGAAVGITMAVGAIAFGYAYFVKRYAPLQAAAGGDCRSGG